MVRLEDGVVLDANPAAGAAFRTSPTKLAGRTLSDLLDPALLRRLREAFADRGTRAVDAGLVKTRRPLGRPVTFQVTASLCDGPDPACLCRLTDPVPAGGEAELRRLNWALGAYARSSAALIHFRDFTELVTDVCEAIVGADQYLLAAVGLAVDAPGKPVRILAGSGKGVEYLEVLSPSWSADSPAGRGPIGIAVRSGEPFVMRDALSDPAFEPWRERAREYGLRSCVVAPFYREDRVAGVVMVYSERTDAFGPHEICVFSELGRELAFAMSVDESRAQLREAEHARKAAEEAAQDTQAELARLARALSVGEFATSIAHELNQPVAAIVTNGDAALRWLAKDPPNLTEVQAAVMRMIRDAGRAGGVIDRTRAMLTKHHPEHAPMDLNHALKEVVQFTRSHQRRAGVTVDLDLARSLPPAFGDRIQVQQVALNLVMNGIEAMKAVKERPRVLTVCSRLTGPTELTVVVEDTGQGFEGECAARVFDPLFTTKPGGMGLGLPISRSIIEDHGGRLWASENQPVGARFQFTLPIAEVQS